MDTKVVNKSYDSRVDLPSKRMKLEGLDHLYLQGRFMDLELVNVRHEGVKEDQVLPEESRWDSEFPDSYESGESKELEQLPEVINYCSITCGKIQDLIIENSIIKKSQFVGVSFDSSEFNECDLHTTFFIDCTFTNVNFRDCLFSQCWFINCEFLNCRFMEVFGKDSKQFIECDIVNCSFDKIAFNQSLTSTHIRNSTFNESKLEGVVFCAVPVVNSTFTLVFFERCFFEDNEDDDGINTHLIDVTLHKCIFNQVHIEDEIICDNLKLNEYQLLTKPSYFAGALLKAMKIGRAHV